MIAALQRARLLAQSHHCLCKLLRVGACAATSVRLAYRRPAQLEALKACATDEGCPLQHTKGQLVLSAAVHGVLIAATGCDAHANAPCQQQQWRRREGRHGTAWPAAPGRRGSAAYHHAADACASEAPTLAPGGAAAPGARPPHRRRPPAKPLGPTAAIADWARAVAGGDGAGAAAAAAAVAAACSSPVHLAEAAEAAGAAAALAASPDATSATAADAARTLTAALAAAAPPLLRRRTPDELADVLWALAAAGAAPGGALASAADAALLRARVAPGGRALVRLSWALAALGSADRSTWVLLAMAAAEQVPAMPPAEVADLVWAFARAGHYNEAVMSRASDVFASAIRRSGFKLPPAPAPAADGAAHSPHHAANARGLLHPRAPLWMSDTPGLTAGMVARWMEACAALRHYSAAGVDAAALAAVNTRGIAFADLAAVTHACGVLNHLSLQLCDKASGAALQYMTAAGVGIARRAAAADARPPPVRRPGGGGALVGGATDAVQRQQQQQQQQQHAALACVPQLAWAFVVLGFMGEAFFEAATALVVSWGPKRLSQEQLACLYQVSLCLSDAAISQPRLRRASLSLGARLTSAAQRAWVARSQHMAEGHQQQVVQCLTDMGFSPHVNYHEGGVAPIDVGLNVRGRRVALSLDGPQCFSANAPYTPLGATVARWRLAQTRGWKVVSIRYADWLRLHTPAAQQEHLFASIQAASSRQPVAAGAMGSPLTDSTAAQSIQTPKAWTLDRLWRLLDV